MRVVFRTLGLAGMVLAMTALGAQPGFAQVAQDPSPGVSTAQGVAVFTPPNSFKPFDMKQCIDGSDHCQLATCVPMATPTGVIYVCQGHGNFFP